MTNNNIRFHDVKLKSLLLVLFAFILSSYGQAQEDSDTINTKPPFNLLQPALKDPSFFIENQLCQHLREIFQDSKGNLWFGTNVYGILKYDGNSLVYLEELHHFKTARITAIVEDTLGNIWFGSGNGLIKFDGKSFTTFTEKDGLLNNEIWSLLIDKNGIFWIGTNMGVSRFDGNQFTTIPLPKNEVAEPNTIYSADRITGIVEDKDGSLWFGTDGFGLYQYDGKSFLNFTMENGLCDNTIYDLMIDSKGNLWIGTFGGGGCKYDGKNFTNFTKDGVISGVEAGGFFEDTNGDIWFAAENNGIYRFDGESFTHLSAEQGLVTNTILSIYKDKEGRFWFGGWGGLFRYDGKTIVSVTVDGPWQK